MMPMPMPMPMPGMNDLPPLSWSSFLGTWRLEPGWLLVVVVLSGAYLLARRRAPADRRGPRWRAASFVLGAVLLWACVASGVGAYAMSVFWMHMVLHLSLIMVVPALLVLGHPLTVLLEAFHGPARERAQRILHSWPVTVLSHPATGVLVYTATIIGTHLTGFMDTMAAHTWLMTSEQVLYVVAGYLFLLPILGDEPTKPNPPYLLRLALLVAAMVPDTIVGIVETAEGPWLTLRIVNADEVPPAVDRPVRVEFVHPDNSEAVPVARRPVDVGSETDGFAIECVLDHESLRHASLAHRLFEASGRRNAEIAGQHGVAVKLDAGQQALACRGRQVVEIGVAQILVSIEDQIVDFP